MSVINKMLRDLDQRQSPANDLAGGSHGDALRSGTSSLAAAPGQSGQAASRRLYPALGLGLLALAVGLGWWATARKPAALGAAPASPVSVSVSVSAAAPGPVAPAVSAPTTVVPAVTALAAAVPAQAVAPVVAPAQAQAPPVKVVQVAPTPLADKSPLAAAKPVPVAAAALPQVPVQAVPTAVASTSSVSADPQPVPVRQAQAGREALAQAQALWAAGSHDAATELLQQALAVLQHGNGNGSQASNAPMLAALARELARMQLAEGRAAAALDTLTRLEPALGKDADVWAMRGNAAQRLGRHQDSVQAYATALQLRPDEQRWLLVRRYRWRRWGRWHVPVRWLPRPARWGPSAKRCRPICARPVWYSASRDGERPASHFCARLDALPGKPALVHLQHIAHRLGRAMG